MKKKKKKITLNFKNGSSVEFNKNSKDVNWQLVDSANVSTYMTKEELLRIYPKNRGNKGIVKIEN